MQRFEDILNTAIDRIKQGEEISAVVSSYPSELQTELSSILSLVLGISELPTKAVPTPSKRKLFLEHQPVKISAFRMLITNFNFSPLIVASVVVVMTGLAYGSSFAKANDPLFVIRKAYENTRLALTTNPEHKAVLQVEIASQRLIDAQEVLSQNSDSGSQEAVLSELDDQTTLALNNLKGVATTISAVNPELVSKVEQLTENKNTLLTKVSPTTAKASETKNKTALEDIKKIIAATDEQNAAKLNNPEAVTSTGKISAIKDTVITIDGNNFEVKPGETKIQELNQVNISGLKDLNINDQVKITAQLKGTKNIATSITRISTVSTTATAGKDGIINSSAPPKEAAPLEKPQDTFGGFIIESPLPEAPQAQ